jgi:predicted DNA-binding protein
MKTHFQLSIDSDMKTRLDDLSKTSGLPIARIIDKILREQLRNYEERFSAVDQSVLIFPQRGTRKLQGK